MEGRFQSNVALFISPELLWAAKARPRKSFTLSRGARVWPSLGTWLLGSHACTPRTMAKTTLTRLPHADQAPFCDVSASRDPHMGPPRPPLWLHFRPCSPAGYPQADCLFEIFMVAHQFFSSPSCDWQPMTAVCFLPDLFYTKYKSFVIV